MKDVQEKLRLRCQILEAENEKLKAKHNTETQRLKERIKELEDQIKSANEEMSQVKTKKVEITEKNVEMKSLCRTLLEKITS